MPISRRAFLQHAAQASAASLAIGSVLRGSMMAAASAARRPRVLLRSAWQTVNIGDIAHTPGVLTLLEKYVPEAKVTLWPSSIDNGVEPMLRQRFPKLNIAQGAEAVAHAIAENDLLLHGSGPSLVGARDVARWKSETGKPYGVFGITLPEPSELSIALLSDAQFVYFRDSVSLQLAKDNGCTCPIMEFGPDGAFAVDLRNDAAAEKFLAAHALEAGKFVCCIPRLRYTPYWLIKKGRTLDAERHARNEQMKEHDHQPLRAAIELLVRETNLKVLLCPEDQTQMAVGKDNIYDKLNDRVKERVVWRARYWLTDEALSTYVRSAGLFGLEMHSPIMCIGNGVPAMVGRFAEQTSKGFMWRDIGLNDWLLDMDNQQDRDRLPGTLLAMVTDREAALAKVAAAQKIVHERQKAMTAQLGRVLNRESGG